MASRTVIDASAGDLSSSLRQPKLSLY
jgi:hypothetical protein